MLTHIICIIVTIINIIKAGHFYFLLKICVELVDYISKKLRNALINLSAYSIKIFILYL